MSQTEVMEVTKKKMEGEDAFEWLRSLSVSFANWAIV